MSDADQELKYDYSLREWVKYGGGRVSERSDTDWVYYHIDLNEFRLGKYLLRFDQLEEFCGGGYALTDTGESGRWLTEPIVHGEIIGLRTEERVSGVSRPGYWIVLNLGQVEIVPGANHRKPASIVGDGITD